MLPGGLVGLRRRRDVPVEGEEDVVELVVKLDADEVPVAVAYLREPGVGVLRPDDPPLEGPGCDLLLDGRRRPEPRDRRRRDPSRLRSARFGRLDKRLVVA